MIRLLRYVVLIGVAVIAHATACVAQSTAAQDKDALIVVRYPARISDQALRPYFSFYDDRGFGNYFYKASGSKVITPIIWGKDDTKPPRDMHDAGAESISKSTYFALATYEYLLREFPAGKVILQPMQIVAKSVRSEKDGVIAPGESWPITLTEQPTAHYPPAPVYVDVAVHINPFYRVYTYNEPTTFGRYVTPLITVRTAPAASPETSGLLVLPQAFVEYTRLVPPDAPADRGLGVNLTEYLDGDQGIPADVDLLNKDLFAAKEDVRPGKVFLMPIKQTELSADELSDDGSGTPLPEEKTTAEIASLLKGAVSSVAYDKATASGRRDYVENFDLRLSSQLARGQLSASDQAKLDLLRQFEQAEWEMLTAEDRQFVKDVFHGEWGQSMRDLRSGENEIVDKVEEARRAAQFQAMAGALAAMSSMNFGSKLSAQQVLQNDMKIMTAAMQAQQATKDSQESIARMVGAFQSRMENSYGQIMKFTVVVNGKKIEVEASNLSELRGKLRSIYLAFAS